MQTIANKAFGKLYTAAFTAIMFTVLLNSCKKNDLPSHGNVVASYSSDVVDKWITLQLRLMKGTTGVANQAFSRHYVYAGIAALESAAPGLSPHSAVYRKWNGLNGLPTPELGVKFYYPANVNAALASISRYFYTNVNATDKAAIDSLEAALNAEFATRESAERLNKSIAFGKAVATAVYNWSETDGYKNANNPYNIPVGEGKWKPTPPANAAPSGPYWGNNRPTVQNSLLNTEPPAPTTYSALPGSDFHNMVKHVYDVSLTLTEDQKAMAIFWRDVPGATSPGHWLSILQQVIKQKHSKLDKAVIAFALSGASINDAVISCWKSKYQYNLLRPITYIREVMGHTQWNSFIGTPAHPEYASGHAVLSGAAAAAMQELFGNSGNFTDHTYDYLGLPARSYNSFAGIAEEAAMSRVYGGIHYLKTCQLGLIQGQKVAANIFGKKLMELEK